MLFDQNEYGQCGVNARRFRADHAFEIPGLDACERIGFIRRDAEKYFISLLGVTHLGSNETSDFFKTAEDLYCALQRRYRAEPGSPVSMSELAKELGLEFRTVFQCLSLMRECPAWCEGFCNADAINNPANASVVPGEGVLVQPSFEICMRNWESQRRQSRIDASQLFPIPSLGTQWGGSHQPYLSEELVGLLPADQVALLREVTQALDNGLLTLASMGLRALIDMVCTDQVSDVGGFQAKVDALLEASLITKSQHPILLTVIDAGNASAHRGFTPDSSDIKTVFSVVQDLLRSLYLHPSQAAVLAKKTPARRARS